MKKNLKKIKTDKSAENLLKKDLSDYIHFKNFHTAKFELNPKNKIVTVRMSEGLLKALKTKAKRQGIHYQKLMRQALEKYL